MDKKEEKHSMEKPKPLEVVSDGDLTEVKKDPEETKKAWEVWLEKKEMHISDLEEGGDGIYRPDVELEAGKKKKRKKQGERVAQENRNRRAYMKYGEGRWEIPDENPKTSDKAYITKPIPDSKGGRGSFQHCINANKDKKNPGGWCKQIERKIGKGKDEGEEEEVKISTYKKLTRIKDRLQAHNKARQTKIDKPKDWWDHSKVGRNTGWEDNPMNKPSYFQAKMEEERKKKKKIDKTEEIESDYYMDAGGNPQRKEKTGESDLVEELRRGRPPLMARRMIDEIEHRYKERKAKEADDEQFNKLTDKTDYFVEEIRANIIYHNKIFPLVGMIAGAAGKVGAKGAKIGGEILDDMGDMAKEEQEQ